LKSNLDKWIKDAKDDVPDSGEYRRLNRAMLPESSITTTPRRRRIHRVLLGSLSLVFLMMFSGQVTQLGSDSFDTTTSTITLPLSSNTVTLHENVFRGGTVYLPGLSSEADVDEYHRSVAAGEGEMVRASGTSYGGKTYWTKLIRRNINGKESEVGDTVQNPKSETPRGFDEFLVAYGKNFNARIKLEPPHGRMQKVIDGVLVDFKFWAFEYPGYGKVTRYFGTPVEKK